MEYTFETKNTCAKIIKFTLNGNIVTNVELFVVENKHLAQIN